MSAIASFKDIENKHDVYRDKDCMKTFWRKHTMKIINFKQKEVIKKMNSRNHIKMQKFVIFVKKSLKINILKIKNIVKVEIIVIIQVNNTEVLHIVYAI